MLFPASFVSGFTLRLKEDGARARRQASSDFRLPVLLQLIARHGAAAMGLIYSCTRSVSLWLHVLDVALLQYGTCSRVSEFLSSW